jgi:hypothetical protein
MVSDAAANLKNVTLVPISVGGQTVYLTTRELNITSGEPRNEREIADRQPRLEKMLAGLAQFTKEVVGTLQETGASKVSVEFGCDFALESGTFIAVIGKASSKSTLKVGLEWSKPEQ